MEEETLKAQAGWEAPQSGSKKPALSFTQKLSGISFTPGGSVQSAEISPEQHARYAIVGIILGILALLLFFIIALGIVFAALGALFSSLGLHSPRRRIARIGLILSVVGGISSIIYMVVVSMGLINYNYFTNELWGIPAGGVQVLE